MAKTSFIDGNQSQGTQGTRVTAAFLNAVNNHRHTGLDVDGAGALDYAADTGSANAYVIALSPALTVYITGVPIVFKATNANTGAATLNVNGLGAKAIRKHGTTALAAGDIAAGQMVEVVYDGTYFQIISTSDAFTASLAASGYQRLPSGLIIQWGSVTSANTGSYSLTFPLTFPSYCREVFPVASARSGYTSADIMAVGAITTSGATIYGSDNADGAATMTFYWFAIGY